MIAAARGSVWYCSCQENKINLKMSILWSTEEGWIISHYDFVDKVYSFVKDSDDKETIFGFNKTLFMIKTPFLKNGQEANAHSYHTAGRPSSRKKLKTDVKSLGEEKLSGQVEHVRNKAEKIISGGQKCGCLGHVTTEEDLKSNNLEARQAAEAFYHKHSKQLTGNFYGGNVSDVTVTSVIQGESYLIPPQCKFFCYDVREMQKHLHLLDDSYDFILLDPPWWNKYIRRKNSKSSSAEGYHMMYNADLAKLPLPSLAVPGSLVAVWCTNCDSHISAIKDSMFPAWGVTYLATWFWLKVTCGGQPVCAYSEPPGKEPFEQIILGWFQVQGRPYPLPEDGKVIVSVPSALHSHKPPLTDVLAKYLPQNPRCMELFARYLLPGYTSWGTEVLKLQQVHLYEQCSS